MTEPYFHGTTETGADNIRSNGIQESQLQSRDRGFFGEGLYVTTQYEIAQRHATTVANKWDDSPAILQVTPDNPEVFHAGDALPDNGSLKPVGNPDWLDDFVNWYVGKVEDAAVWERIPGTERKDVVPRARQEVTPGTDSFDRENWYCEVTAYAFENGYDVVFWSDSEIIINPDANPTFE